MGMFGKALCMLGPGVVGSCLLCRAHSRVWLYTSVTLPAADDDLYDCIIDGLVMLVLWALLAYRNCEYYTICSSCTLCTHMWAVARFTSLPIQESVRCIANKLRPLHMTEASAV
jgi:hypothetical protein